MGSNPGRRETNEMIRNAGLLDRPPIDPAASALVIIDMVQWQVPRAADGALATPCFVRRLADAVIPRLRRLLAACRSANVPVVFLRVGACRSDFSDALPALRNLFETADARDGSPACEVIPEVQPRRGEISLMKPGSGGFMTTSLDTHLRNLGVRHVMYTGVLTDACVLLTLAAGYDLGYFGYLISDATATLSEEAQRSTELLVSSFMAEVIDTESALHRISAEPVHA
jgi:nicotinamidase-related amidase